MIKNYIKIALRNFIKHKGYGFINIAGLTIGAACCIVIFQYVAFEYSFDDFHTDKDKIYRILQSTPLVNEPVEQGGAFTGFALAPALADQVPDIRYVTRVHPEYDAAVISSQDEPERIFEEQKVLYVDPAFLRIFSFPLLSGDDKSALQSGTALLSASAARKYFGEENPLGKALNVTGQISRSYRVNGVFADVPMNSHLQFEFLLPVEDLVKEGYTEEPEGGWSWNNFITYIKLYKNADYSNTLQKMTEAYKTRRSEMLRQQGRTVKLWAQPLKDIHLNSEIDAPVAEMGSYRSVYFFTIIGLITLLIALVNYVNLETARAIDRAREIGVRKVIGAHRRQLIIQFLTESAIMNLIAAAFAFVISEALAPILNRFAGITIPGTLYLNPLFWIAFLFIFILSTLLAGIYPSFVLSSFKPVTALKGKGGSFKGQLWMRRGLVILQFTASVVLIGGTIIVYDQLGFMRNMELGLKIDQVLSVTGPRILPEDRDYNIAMRTFTNELQRLPGISQTATSSSLPGKGFNWNGASIRKSTDGPADVKRGVATYVDTNFFKTYDMHMIAGKGFSDITLPVPDDIPWPVVANETAVKALGFSSPSSAINQLLDIGGYTARIVGVLRDFNWSSAHTPRQNIFFGPVDAGRIVSIRIKTADIAGTLRTVEEIYRRIFPGNVFSYEFVDETFQKQYENEQRFASLFTMFAVFAILIACSGLFGLAAFTIRQRTKEIGIRKVLGASAAGIMALLTRDFLILVAAAIVIATPVIYYLMSGWLEDFAYRIKPGPVTFLVTTAIVILIAVMTVSIQSVRAAAANPVKSLKYE